ncbi:hypothetical protein GCM10009642_62550 [Nocardiopsis metallicus]
MWLMFLVTPAAPHEQGHRHPGETPLIVVNGTAEAPGLTETDLSPWGTPVTVSYFRFGHRAVFPRLVRLTPE